MTKKKKTKILYTEDCGTPLRIKITPKETDRVNKLQAMLKKLPLKRNESGVIEVYLDEGIIRVWKDFIDIGVYGYEGWDSFLPEINPKRIDQIPDVYFSKMYLYYMNDDTSEGRKEEFKKLILPRHRELIVWKKIGGEI